MDDGAIDFEPGVERTDRWRGIGAAALLAGAVGLVARQPSLVLVGASLIALLAYARATTPPALALSVRRQTSVDPGSVDGDGAALGDAVAGDDTVGSNVGGDSSGEGSLAEAGGGSLAKASKGSPPEAGQRIEVTLTVENAGDRTIPDLRLVDGVPDGLAVVEGSPGVGTTLRPGEVVTCRYALEARAGSHAFGPAFATVRDVAGVVERRDRIAVEDAEAVEAEPSTTLDTSPPLRTPAARFAGGQTADETGEGVAFEHVREYRHGDPPARIDWRRLARGGDLSTVAYREDRGVSVVVAVDARPAAARAPAPDRPTAAERGLSAANAIVERLAADGHRVGAARLGAARGWVAPGGGPEHRRRLSELLAERSSDADGAVDTGGSGGDGRGDLAWLGERLGSHTEALLLTPALDDGIVDLAKRLEATGTPVTVVAPDPTDDATVGRRLARIERRHRLRSLCGAGIPTTDWADDEPLGEAARREVVQP